MYNKDEIKGYHLENVKVYRNDVYSVACIRDRKFTNVAEGDFRGRHFVLGINWFGVPVLYIEVLEDDGVDDYDGEDFVGKIGKDEEGHWRKGDERRYYGWDYGHSWDWEPEYGYSLAYGGLYKKPNWEPTGHKYNLVELFMEVAEKTREIEYDIWMRGAKK